MTPSLSAIDSTCDRGLRILLAASAVTPFVYVPGVLYPSVVPRAAYFRILVAMGTVLMAVGWARRRRSKAFRAWRRERVGLTLAAFAAVAALAAGLGEAPVEGLLGGMIRMDGAVAWVGYLLFYVLLRSVLDETSWRPFLRLVVLVSVAVAGWSLLQAYGEHVGLALVGWGELRVLGTVGLEGPLAVYMLLAAAVAGYLATEAPNLLRRLGWTVVVALDLWVAVLTGTRSVLVAAAVALAAVGTWALLFSERDSAVRRLAVRGLAGIAVVVVGLLFVRESAFPAVGRILDIGGDALSTRIHLWRTAWSGFLEQPLLGAGLESFDLLYDRHFQVADYLASGAAHHDRAHNVLLGKMAESGVVGLVAYLSFWAASLGAVVSALRESDREPGLLWPAAGVAAYLVYLQLWFEDLVSFHLLLVILAFLEHRRLTSSTGDDDGGGRSTGARPGSTPRSVWTRWTVVAGAGLLLVAAGWYHVQVLGAARETRRGMASASAMGPFRHFSEALDYRTATTREITSRYVAGLEGLTTLLRRDRVDPEADSVDAVFDRGERAIRAEIARHPDHSLVHARLARLFQARWRWTGSEADFRAAERQLEDALDASPGRLRYVHRLARLYTQNGNPARAMDLLERARARLPGWWETYNTMAQVQWDAGNREAAVDYLFRAARTDVRWKTAGTGSEFMVRAGAWLEARGTPREAVELYRAYLGSRYPGWEGARGGPIGDVPGDALPIAARLPITLLRAGRTGDAAGAARRLLDRLPPHLRRPEVTDRLHRFLADLEAGRTERWRGEWGVLPTDVPLEG